ncbi:TetR/AcrR family transcriptional regulator C-terminal domain-containing protein [Janibacter cremeus]|uniref:TetR/AcrR family transcriptional regulator C-terminal domain-containing protein n=1 Tax=Janibacter cremeus TaxID=1285192 RepID=UPI0023F6CB4B|nr:TetR/AcrR family transcriptional regulator C-terminal domain-containing protein [Janibacter cremeus]WEV78864.1 TetR/AcrR family transcriptional regulator C-terminal domain-containing protein [Janibacter cremeus]
MTTSPESTGSRTRLDRERVVHGAIEVIAAHGVDGLTMRRVGQELGVEAMALYRYVSGRDELLEAVVDALLGGITTKVEAQGFDSWQGYLQALAHEVRGVALTHPAAFPLAATRHPEAPWLRPPLRSIAVVEHFLATLTGAGFDDTAAVDAYKLFTTFLIGSLLLEVAAHGSDIAGVGQAGKGGAPATLSGELEDAPHVRRTQQRLSKDTSKQEFEVGLEALIDRIERSF